MLKPKSTKAASGQLELFFSCPCDCVGLLVSDVCEPTTFCIEAGVIVLLGMLPKAVLVGTLP